MIRNTTRPWVITHRGWRYIRSWVTCRRVQEAHGHLTQSTWPGEVHNGFQVLRRAAGSRASWRTDLEAQVYGNMGITKMNMNVMEEAIGYFEQQLAMLQQLSESNLCSTGAGPTATWGIATRPWATSEKLSSTMSKYLSVAQSLNRMQDQAKAYEAWEMDTGKNDRGQKYELVNLHPGAAVMSTCGARLQSSSTHRSLASSRIPWV